MGSEPLILGRSNPKFMPTCSVYIDLLRNVYFDRVYLDSVGQGGNETTEPSEALRCVTGLNC